MRPIKTLILLSLCFALPTYADGIEEYRQGIAKQAKEGSSVGPGMEKVNAEMLETAMGHYAKTRALLIAALNEFDKGLKVANPNAILDSKEWRASVIDRTHELEKVLDPQPRATRGGVKFSADTRLLDEAKHK